MFGNETSDKKTIEWTTDATNKDVHTFEIVYDQNADYELKVKYLDFSGNKSDIKSDDQNAVVEIYNSKKVTVDKIDPIIKVEYSNNDVKNAIDNRKYYDKNQTATITVTEHNFRADDVNVDVIAQNVLDEDITVADFDALMRTRTEWRHYDSKGNEVAKAVDGNVHVAKISYIVDANYSFDIEYKDLAGNEATAYTTDYFTVDKTKPECVKVAYSTNVFENILEDITFGYYNAQMTVTITAQDEISGVYHFVYSYLKGANVSGVNAQLIDEAIANADITYDGKTATAEFKIPKLTLKDDNQFNGIIEFTAYDRSENESKKFTDESTVIVVDNIKPTSQVTFNDPIQKVGDVSYYAGNINATIVVSEANFYSQDVQVVVTKNGANYPVTVNWTDNSIDVHTGTFTLTEDGGYIVNVTYVDRSKNEMTPYVSNQLTIDTKNPVINVSNVKHQSANNAETISITVSVTDTNIPLENFKPS